MGIDFDHSPTWRNYRDDIRLEVSDCRINIQNQFLLLNSKDSYEKTFSIIESFDKSFAYNAKLLIDSGELKVKDFTQAVRNKYSIDKKTSALYIHEEKSIYINKQDELGLLTIFFYHELAHAFDELIPSEMDEVLSLYEEYTNYYDKLVAEVKTRGYTDGTFLGNYLTLEEDRKLEELYNSYNSIDQVVRFRAERYAFDQQDIFVKYLTKEYECYDSYIEEHKSLNKLKLYKDTPNHYIRSAYGL